MQVSSTALHKIFFTLQINMQPSSVPIYFGDAFTLEGNSFTGNPGVVVIQEYDDDISSEQKQQIANEVNMTASAFLSLEWKRPTSNIENGESCRKNGLHEVLSKDDVLSKEKLSIHRKVRWFSPEKEVPLCGHATLIAGKVLGQAIFESNPQLKDCFDEVQIEFDSPFRGKLGASYNHKTGKVTLNFPLSPCLPLKMQDNSLIKQLADALFGSLHNSRMIQDIQYSPSSSMGLIRLKDDVTSDEFFKISPNFTKLLSVKLADDMIGLILTVKGREGNVEKKQPHFYCRYLSPWQGFNEDPVCGSAHTVLLPYWLKEYKGQVGETLLSRQHTVRGGFVYCSMIDQNRVTLSGNVRLTIQGRFKL